MRPQALQPWRRVFRAAFAHDKASGGLYCLQAPDAGGRRSTVSRLSARCREKIPDFEASLPLLCQGLELPEWTMPVAPPQAMAPTLQPFPDYQVPPHQQLQSLARHTDRESGLCPDVRIKQECSKPRNPDTCFCGRGALIARHFLRRGHAGFLVTFLPRSLPHLARAWVKEIRVKIKWISSLLGLTISPPRSEISVFALVEFHDNPYSFENNFLGLQLMTPGPLGIKASKLGRCTAGIDSRYP